MFVIDHAERTYGRLFGCDAGRAGARGSIAAACGITDEQTDALIDQLLRQGLTFEAITAQSLTALEALALPPAGA